MATVNANDPLRLNIADPLLRRLFGYWDKERNDRPMPARKDIDPVNMPYILKNLMLIDVLDNPRRFHIRLQGTELFWWIGCDLTGKMLKELPSAELRAIAHECLTSVTETRLPYHRLGSQVLNGLPRHFEALVLPLCANGTSVMMMLAAVRCRNTRPESAYRFKSPWPRP